MIDETLTLGDIIDKLKQFPLTAKIYFDFCGTIPDGFTSWRGRYDELALNWKKEGSNDVTVEKLLGWCAKALETTFGGYKGGDFTMGPDTKVWVDNYSEYTCTGIEDIFKPEDDYNCWRVIIKTRFVET